MTGADDSSTRTTRPPVREGDLLRTPTEDERAQSGLGRYARWLTAERGLTFDDYDDLWHWSVTEIEAFWGSLWEFFGIGSRDEQVRAGQVLADRSMPGAHWFPEARLNYAAHALGRPEDSDQKALIAYSQTRGPIELTFGELRDQVGRARAGLIRLGVGPGDRVVAYLPNVPETVVAFLAAASIGAIWASCAPEFGARSVVERFAQLDPTVLLAVSGYGYREREVDREDEVAEIRAGLPTLEHVVHVPYGQGQLPGAISWDELLAEAGDPTCQLVAFDHPLYVLFSSGTTGKPKAIVHGHGGILMEHLKGHTLTWDMRAGDRMLWFTTTAWMMWNLQVSALLVGATAVLIDGDPLYPDLEEQWRLAGRTKATIMGVSPGYLTACRRAGLEPARLADLSQLRQLGVSGAPLTVDGFAWVFEQLGRDVLLNVGSGGTDICCGLVAGSPWQPVWAGEMSGPCLGVNAQAFDEEGKPCIGKVGELVVTEPMPSMPVGFWGDADGERYRAAYFDDYPGIWRHGDWVTFTERGSCVVSGRSDATLNRGGVRLGTSDFYGVVERMPEIVDSLVVHLEGEDGTAGEILLYVVPAAGVALDDDLRARLRLTLRRDLSPRHVPDDVISVQAIPRNLTGKKLEVPVKRLLKGARVEDVLSRDAMLDPSAIDSFLAHVEQRRRNGADRAETSG